MQILSFVDIGRVIDEFLSGDISPSNRAQLIERAAVNIAANIGGILKRRLIFPMQMSVDHTGHFFGIEPDRAKNPTLAPGSLESRLQKFLRALIDIVEQLKRGSDWTGR